jgi:hypothetical protein
MPSSPNGMDTDSTTTQHLTSILARQWADELGDEAYAILNDNATDNNNEPSSESNVPYRDTLYSLESRRDLLPPKQQAKQWLQTFLEGPNKWMQICLPVQSQYLLDALYDPQHAIDGLSECLITWQLAVGCRYTSDINEQIYTVIYTSAQIQMEICIERDDNAQQLWVVPILLLRCVYLMTSKPRNCWLVLGKLSFFRQTFDDQAKENHD